MHTQYEQRPMLHLCHSPLRNRSRRCGFTLNELVVVLSVISVLISLHLPDVMPIRDAAARLGVKNRFMAICQVLERYRDENGQYYFCSYGASPSDLPSTALTWDRFEALIASLNAGRVILFLDTCHSGDVIGRVSGDRFAEDIARHSAVVFTSCKGIEYSLEDPRLGHGLFTYALLKGMEGEADLLKDGQITMSELKAYVENSVPLMARKFRRIQTPFTPRLERYADFVIASVN